VTNLGLSLNQQAGRNLTIDPITTGNQEVGDQNERTKNPVFSGGEENGPGVILDRGGQGKDKKRPGRDLNGTAEK